MHFNKCSTKREVHSNNIPAEIRSQSIGPHTSAKTLTNQTPKQKERNDKDQNRNK